MTKPEILYHYTDTAAMLSILRSGHLWATDANYLNDSRELRHGRDALCSALTAKQQELSANWRGVNLGWISRELQQDPDSESSIHHETSGPYVSCFCEDGDLLSQWRGYAGGSGWAIGFHREWLETLCYRPGGPQSLRKVVYGSEAIPPMIKRVIEDLTVDPLARKGPSWQQAREICDTGLAAIPFS